MAREQKSTLVIFEVQKRVFSDNTLKVQRLKCPLNQASTLVNEVMRFSRIGGDGTMPSCTPLTRIGF
jgi:hypothetical protein